uniref:Subtilisin n=1 Tax=Macrostomum lignano TaxID=282301 RepID=A0A1I8FBQ8_9PLAT
MSWKDRREEGPSAYLVLPSHPACAFALDGLLGFVLRLARRTGSRTSRNGIGTIRDGDRDNSGPGILRKFGDGDLGNIRDGNSDGDLGKIRRDEDLGNIEREISGNSGRGSRDKSRQDPGTRLHADWSPVRHLHKCSLSSVHIIFLDLPLMPALLALTEQFIQVTRDRATSLVASAAFGEAVLPVLMAAKEERCHAKYAQQTASRRSSFGRVMPIPVAAHDEAFEQQQQRAASLCNHSSGTDERSAMILSMSSSAFGCPLQRRGPRLIRAAKLTAWLRTEGIDKRDRASRPTCSSCWPQCQTMRAKPAFSKRVGERIFSATGSVFLLKAKRGKSVKSVRPTPIRSGASRCAPWTVSTLVAMAILEAAFCLQDCSQPITYAVALTEKGPAVVHNLVAMSQLIGPDGKAVQPADGLGALLTAALIGSPQDPLSARFSACAVSTAACWPEQCRTRVLSPAATRSTAVGDAQLRAGRHSGRSTSNAALTGHRRASGLPLAPRGLLPGRVCAMVADILARAGLVAPVSFQPVGLGAANRKLTALAGWTTRAEPGSDAVSTNSSANIDVLSTPSSGHDMNSCDYDSRTLYHVPCVGGPPGRCSVRSAASAASYRTPAAIAWDSRRLNCGSHSGRRSKSASIPGRGWNNEESAAVHRWPAASNPQLVSSTTMSARSKSDANKESSSTRARRIRQGSSRICRSSQPEAMETGFVAVLELGQDEAECHSFAKWTRTADGEGEGDRRRGGNSDIVWRRNVGWWAI